MHLPIGLHYPSQSISYPMWKSGKESQNMLSQRSRIERESVLFHVLQSVCSSTRGSLVFRNLRQNHPL